MRLAVSSTYWPWIWPRPDAAGFTLDPAGSSLTLPVRRRTEDAVAWEEPEQAEPLGVVHPSSPEERRPERVVVRDVAKGEWRLEVDPKYGGTRVYPDGLEFTEDALETYTIEESGPLTARTRSDWTIWLRRPDRGWDVGVDTRSEITCDAEAFHTWNEVVCRRATRWSSAAPGEWIPARRAERAYGGSGTAGHACGPALRRRATNTAPAPRATAPAAARPSCGRTSFAPVAARVPPVVTGVVDEPPCWVVPVVPVVVTGAGVEVEGDGVGVGVGFGLSPLAARMPKSAYASSRLMPQVPSLFSYWPKV